MTNLIEKCAFKIVKWCFHDEAKISTERKEILVYGYTLFLENLYKTAILLLIALVTGTFWKTLVIIGSFSLLRCFSGGIHCSSSLGCTLGMLGLWIVGLIVANIELPLIALIMMGIIIIWTILRYAPRGTKNNPIRTKKIWKQKRMGAILVMTFLLTTGIVCALFFNRPEVLNMILTSLYIEAFSILLLAEKEEQDNDEFEESYHQAW